jgi:hypothetical protein
MNTSATSTEPREPYTLTSRDVAAHFGLHQSSLHRAEVFRRHGLRVGGRWRWRVSDLDRIETALRRLLI